MPDYRKCALYLSPETETRRPKVEAFDLVHEFFETSHDWRSILRCRECGQIYLFDFHEVVDWENGMDGQYSTYIPVESVEQAMEFAGRSHLDLCAIAPRLQADFPSGGHDREIAWVREDKRS